MTTREGTLAGVREKTTTVLTEAEQIINDDKTRSALITVTLLTKIGEDNDAETGVQ